MDIYFGGAGPYSIAIRINIRPDGSPGIESFAREADGSLFTSGLSVKEFALLGAVGPRPLAQVMGGSVVWAGQALLPAVPPARRWGSSGSNYARLEEPSGGGGRRRRASAGRARSGQTDN